MIAAPSHRKRKRFTEGVVFTLFRVGTYFVLLCATYIFLDIGIKGGRTVFTRTAPFVNLKFLSEPPQTLYVFDYQGKKMELSDREFREWKTTHKEDVDVTSVSYSAGGIWPCIVGTALLVIGSMTLAVFIGIARVSGETAPIIFTAAYAMRDEMPWQVSHWTNFFFQGVMALPYHIYVVSSKIPQNEYTERVQYGTAFVFLAIVMLIALTSILLREKKRRRLSW